jgi:Xaa-Pro aminopeptidase
VLPGEALSDRLQEMPRYIESEQADAWIVYGYKDINPTFGHFFDGRRISRRAFFIIPVSGAPRLIVHAVDADRFKDVDRRIYHGREDMLGYLAEEVARNKRVLMEYSPLGALPANSFLDAGTYQLLSDIGFEIRSSADVHQSLFARWTAADRDDHARAATVYFEALQATFLHVRQNLGRITERGVLDYLTDQVARNGCEICVPCVAVNQNSAMPSYTLKGAGATVHEGDWLFVDCHCRIPGKVFADITWVSYVGQNPPARYVAAFEAVRDARDMAVDAVRAAYRDKRRIEGWELDRLARDYFGQTNNDKYFTHRLGHSLGKDIHGPGANLDDFESHDTRQLIPGTAFTIEPGLYYADFGVRTEINVLLDESGPSILTPEQKTIQCI